MGLDANATSVSVYECQVSDQYSTLSLAKGGIFINFCFATLQRSWKLLDAVSLHSDARSFKPHKSKLALRKKFAFEHWSLSCCKTSLVPNSKWIYFGFWKHFCLFKIASFWIYVLFVSRRKGDAFLFSGEYSLWILAIFSSYQWNIRLSRRSSSQTGQI